MSFIPSTPNERNDYAAALAAALTALKADSSAIFTVTPESLKRTTPYNAQGAFVGLKKLIDAGKLPAVVMKGTDSDTGAKVVGIAARS